ncbi:hypothetical protein V6N13_039428 [Hibiscus sabdariffa]|uniref:Uncharacterized protein n=1 Tax=Hibiscus sabdariffa TaxID=183260 RepID=A0ABR2SWD3_9ROSI
MPTCNNPLSSLNLFSNCKDFGFYEKKKSIARHKKKKKKKKKVLTIITVIITVTVGGDGLAVKMKPRLFSLQGTSHQIHPSPSPVATTTGDVPTEKGVAMVVGEGPKTEASTWEPIMLIIKRRRTK